MARLVDLPERGQLVDVRQRRYVVLSVLENTLPRNPLTTSLTTTPTQHLVTLSSVEDDGLGEELQVIWEVEPGTHTIEKTPLPEPVAFDPPQRLDTFLNAVRWGAASSANIRTIQAPFRSGIDLEDYQLDPVARAIQMPRVNLLIADDVGLGKTIEAGLVAQELIIRHRARRILIVCPASLQVQWRDQMRDKFGLEFRIVDSSSLHELRRERGLYVNPWTHFPRLITSIDFLKRERPFRLFTEILPPEGASPYPRKFDLLILDEAHNVAPSGRGKYATDSQRTQTLRRLAPHFEHKLFLSATPHNGFQNSFSSLLELLDNQRFARGVEPDPKQLDAVMVRRLKSELTKWNGKPRFPHRDIQAIEVHYTAQERSIHQTLQQYSELRLKNCDVDNHTEQYATRFVSTLLKKRLFSSPAAFSATLTRHEQTLREARQRKHALKRPSLGILRSRIEQLEEERDDDASLIDATHEALETTAPLFHPLTSQEELLLSQMRRWAEHAQDRPDSKAQELVSWLKTHIKPGGTWSEKRVIIFTEYLDTQHWLYNLLADEGFAEKGPDGERRLLTLYGGMVTEERERIKAAFQANPADSSVRILLATDAASEGIDLQNYCSQLIHYEIPWNPNRLEQRNGRVDRHGQRADNIDIYHFVSTTYKTYLKTGVPSAEKLDADLEFLMTAAKKVDQIRIDLGNVGPVISDQVEEAMLGQRQKLDTARAEANAPSRRLKYFTRRQREINERINQLYKQLQEGRDELQMTPENIQAVVETALELAQQPPLQRRILHDPHGEHPDIEVFDVPALSDSWASCTHGLEHPHTHEKRPIVFDHNLVRERDDVVLAHLNHRLVTMSLRLLRAEIWSDTHIGNHKLNRVTARTVSGFKFTDPMVIAHARLLILGGDNQRLHEEVIAAGGSLPATGRFVRMNEGQLKEALAAITPNDVNEAWHEDLRAAWPTHREALIQALERRMGERAASLRRELEIRSDKEQKDIRMILTELQQQILQEIKQPEVIQLQLASFSTDEAEQLKRDLRGLEERAHQIDEEIRQEVERIQQRFANPQARLFPIAISYLIPEHMVQ